jgi:putative addiction module component (TIGR02574 family)
MISNQEVNMGTQELVALVLKLDPAERFDLIDQALHSLDKPDPEIDRVWIEEAERRLAAHRAGKVQGIPMEEVFRDL